MLLPKEKKKPCLLSLSLSLWPYTHCRRAHLSSAAHYGWTDGETDPPLLLLFPWYPFRAPFSSEIQSNPVFCVCLDVAALFPPVWSSLIPLALVYLNSQHRRRRNDDIVNGDNETLTIRRNFGDTIGKIQHDFFLVLPTSTPIPSKDNNSLGCRRVYMQSEREGEFSLSLSHVL